MCLSVLFLFHELSFSSFQNGVIITHFLRVIEQRDVIASVGIRKHGLKLIFYGDLNCTISLLLLRNMSLYKRLQAEMYQILTWSEQIIKSKIKIVIFLSCITECRQSAALKDCFGHPNWFACRDYL